MDYIKPLQVSKFQQFVMNKLYAHNKNVHLIPLKERLSLTLEIVTCHEKIFELMSKNDNFYLNFLSVSKIILLQSDKENIYDLINIAFEVVINNIILNGNADDFKKLAELQKQIKDLLPEHKINANAVWTKNNKKVSI